VGLEPEAPPKEKAPGRAPTGAEGGLEGGNRRLPTVRQVPSLVK